MTTENLLKQIIEQMKNAENIGDFNTIIENIHDMHENKFITTAQAVSIITIIRSNI